MQDLGKYTKRNHVEIQTRYVSFLIAGSVALVSLVFALGVLVGSRHDNSQACAQPDPLAALDLDSKEPSPPAAQATVDFSFHESLGRRPDPVPTPASLVTAEAPADAEATAPPEMAPHAEPLALITPTREESPIPEKVAHDEPGTYSLQVGSFQDRLEATQMVRKLERAGHDSFLVSVNMPDRGGRWYRVRVGPFQSKKAAWQYKELFEQRERLPAFVVKRRARS